MDVRDDYALLGGLRFHYRDWGGDLPPLVLLHGFTGHARTWDRFAAAMRDRYRVLALDQRGHGESAWAEDYRVEAMADDLERFATALGLDRFALLGLSMGGRTAYWYAALHPRRVERLVIVDIGPEMNPVGSARIRAGTQANDLFADPEAAIAQARRGNARADEQELRHRTRNNLMRTEDGRWTFRYDRALRQPETSLPRPDPAASWLQLPKITAPTLLVRGGESDVLAPEVAQKMVEAIPHCRMVEVPGSGHSVPLDRPAEFEAAVRPFLEA